MSQPLPDPLPQSPRKPPVRRILTALLLLGVLGASLSALTPDSTKKVRAAPPVAAPTGAPPAASNSVLTSTGQAGTNQRTTKAVEQRTGIELLWSAPEPLLQGGQVSRPPVNRSLTLPLSAAQLAQVKASGTLQAVQPALQQVYAQVESRQPKEVRFALRGKEWIAQAQTGWKVDRARTEAALLAALGRDEPRSVLSVKLVAPARNVAWAAAQGMGHLGTGETTFAGSPEFRIQNIRVGASRVHGAWVAPGEDFNFNALIGPINADTGFRKGYVVTGNTLSLEDGGGICQVSTTVFRAAFRAGLPITERYSHSYQVGYYGAPGIDAAVYAPSKNLRWRNDTGRPLLVQASWDIPGARLSIDLFGRPDGRKVEIGTPDISGVQTSPPPTFIADATMAQGTVRRVDMPAAGAQVSVSRQISFPDGRVRREDLLSSYRAWGGVFAVPKGDPRLN